LGLGAKRKMRVYIGGTLFDSAELDRPFAVNQSNSVDQRRLRN
jgi:hypothetical protein